MCWYCGSPVTEPEPVGRSCICSCGKDIRCCRNCRFYLPGMSGNCSEPNAGEENDSERANFCDWFSLNPHLRSPGRGASRAPAQDARSAFNSLFS